MPRYIAQTQPGFEQIAAQEIATISGTRVQSTRAVADKNGMVLFDYGGDGQALMDLRTTEDLFEQVLHLPDLAPTYGALRGLEEAVQRSSAIASAVARARQLRPGYGGTGKLRFRVVARQVGEARFRRVDAQRAVEKGMLARADRSWRVEEEGAIELWLTLFPGEALLALRLTDERMRHRAYKLEHMPASLRPTAAAALVWLTQPADDDVFLDPMCGAGTILIERAHAGRYRRLLGGDESPEAVETARANIGSRYQPIELREWDARSLPLDAGSVTAVAVNLPFGTQVGSPEENRSLYPAFVREAARVLRPGGRMVALTSDVRTLGDAIRRTSALREQAAYPVTILGHRARVLVIARA